MHFAWFCNEACPQRRLMLANTHSLKAQGLCQVQDGCAMTSVDNNQSSRRALLNRIHNVAISRNLSALEDQITDDAWELLEQLLLSGAGGEGALRILLLWHNRRILFLCEACCFFVRILCERKQNQQNTFSLCKSTLGHEANMG